MAATPATVEVLQAQAPVVHDRMELLEVYKHQLPMENADRNFSTQLFPAKVSWKVSCFVAVSTCLFTNGFTI